MKKFNQKKHSLSWKLSSKLWDLNQEEQEGLVRELLQSVSFKKIKEIEKIWFTNKEGK